MLLERRPVSRKTPQDGRLELSERSAARLSQLGARFPVVALGREDAAELETFTCTCAKRAGDPHVHHFVVSPLLRELSAGTEVTLDLDERSGTLRVEPSQPDLPETIDR